MKLFDNKVQELKYNVLREVAMQTWKGYDAFSVFNEIANTLVKKDEPPQSCCIYKDRAVVADRIRLAIGGNKYNTNVVQVIDIACDECPEAGYVVTDMCRGCIAHSCRETCKLNAIEIDSHQRAHINKSKCVECGQCAKACKYNAIHNFKRPCESACKVDAISMADKISHNLSPMAELGKFIKEQDPTGKVIFIGPCIAKKAEVKKYPASKYVDFAMTFEELQALLDSREIWLSDLEETNLNDASFYGRNFASAGGVVKAIEQALVEMGVDDFEFKPVACDGLDKCRVALLQAEKGVLKGNFIEGMGCTGGCVGGSGNLSQLKDAPRRIMEHSETASESKIIRTDYKPINII